MISIIVPVYKVELYLRQCVDSILAQTYRDIEVLLIDDGSPDRCGEICDEYAEKDDRVRAFHTENRGLSAARNLGLRESKGEYIGFVDSDDWIEPDMYEVLLRRMQETGAKVGICRYTEEDLNVKSSKSESHASETVVLKDNKEVLTALINLKVDAYVWNKLFIRELFDAVSFPENHNFEDIASMHFVLGRVDRLVIIPENEYHYRSRNESITNTYTASNLIDFADSYLSRYYYFKSEEYELYNDNKGKLITGCIIGIARVWLWWYGCKVDEKTQYRIKIEELCSFAREHFSVFMPVNVPLYFRLTVPFLKHSNKEMFAFLYVVNKLLLKGIQNPVLSYL